MIVIVCRNVLLEDDIFVIHGLWKNICFSSQYKLFEGLAEFRVDHSHSALNSSTKLKWKHEKFPIEKEVRQENRIPQKLFTTLYILKWDWVGYIAVTIESSWTGRLLGWNSSEEAKRIEVNLLHIQQMT